MDDSSILEPALDLLTSVSFKIVLRGYDPDGVDDFLDRTSAEVEQLREQLRQQSQQLKQAAERIHQLEAARGEVPTVAPTPPPAPVATAGSSVVPEHVTRMIAMAQEFVAKAEADAQQRASELTSGAHERANQIVSDAQERAKDEIERLNGLKQRLSEDVNRLAQQVESERTRLRTQLHSFLQWIEENVQTTPPVAVPRPAPVAPSAPAAATPVPTPAERPTTIGQALNFDQRPSDGR